MTVHAMRFAQVNWCTVTVIQNNGSLWTVYLPDPEILNIHLQYAEIVDYSMVGNSGLIETR